MPIAEQRRLYIEACAAQQSAHLPVSRVLNKLNSAALVLRHYTLGPHGGVALAVAVTHNRSWVQLDLCGTGLGEIGGEAIANAVLGNGTVQALDLSECQLGTRGVRALADTLRTGGAPRLSSLRLRANGLRDGGCAQIADALHADDRHLDVLDLADNGIGAAGARALALLLQQGLVGHLDVGWNRLGADGALELLAGIRTATYPERLKHLHAAWNGLGERGGIAMGEALCCAPGLVSLDLSHNHMQQVSAHALAAGIRASGSLRSLELSCNPFGRAGVEGLMRALEGNETLSELGLSSVEMSMLDEGKGNAGEQRVPFDHNAPAGTYRLDLEDPWERWVASQLRAIALSQPGASWSWATIETRENELQEQADAGDTRGRRASEPQPEPRAVMLSKEWELPRAGILRLELAFDTPQPTSIVHYRLDLANPRERAVARQLWTRALAEPGENWRDEKLDGHAFSLSETSGTVWEVPDFGILELDYATFSLVYEEHYSLDLSSDANRAVLHNLLERAALDASENFVNETLDGKPYSLPDDALAREAWSMPRQGRLELDFVCTQPQHVSTRHYALDLSVKNEWLLAERLRQWALTEPGENWMNETLDGDPIEFNESAAPHEPLITIRTGVVKKKRVGNTSQYRAHAAESRPNLPRRGLLEFDYVTLKPRTSITASSTEYKLDLAKPEDRAIAETLKSMGADMVGESWHSEAIDGKPQQMNEDDPEWELPEKGMLTLDFQETVPYAPLRRVDERELARLLEMLRRRQRVSEYDQLEMLRASSDAFSFSSAQVARLVREIESPSLRFKLALLLFEKCVDKPKFGAVARMVADGGDLLAELRRRFKANKMHITEWTSGDVSEMPRPAFRREISTDKEAAARAAAAAAAASEKQQLPELDARGKAAAVAARRRRQQGGEYELWPDDESQEEEDGHNAGKGSEAGERGGDSSLSDDSGLDDVA